jgi:hypothetical protein
MFMFHIAFSLGLIALTAGTILFIWSKKHKDVAGVGLAEAIGILVIIFAIGSTICTIYYGVKYWQQGSFQNLMGMHGMMEDKGMPGRMMNPTDMNNSDQTKNHSSHHSQ